MKKDKNSTPKTRSNRRAWIVAAISTAILLVAGCFIYSFLYTLTHNKAVDVLEPIGKALEERGAVKQCGSGDTGRGPDNQNPYYAATYGLEADESEAIAIMYEATKSAGYNPVHASPTNRGFLDAVADIYIDKWYFDDTSKASPYSDLHAGNIRLSVVVYGEGSEDTCTQGTIPAGHSTIGVSVSLPDYK